MSIRDGDIVEFQVGENVMFVPMLDGMNQSSSLSLCFAEVLSSRVFVEFPHAVCDVLNTCFETQDSVQHWRIVIR